MRTLQSFLTKSQLHPNPYLSKTEVTLEEGSTDTIEVIDAPTGAEITWSSSDESVATVEDGVITAENQGNASIYAQVGNIAILTCSVTVNLLTPSNITLETHELNMNIGDSETIAVATLSPQDAIITWSSNNESVATVTDEGIVNAVAAGEATITATIDGSADMCGVIVTA